MDKNTLFDFTITLLTLEKSDDGFTRYSARMPDGSIVSGAKRGHTKKVELAIREELRKVSARMNGRVNFSRIMMQKPISVAGEAAFDRSKLKYVDK